MTVTVRTPSSPLAPFVERLGYYACDFLGGWERMVPTGTAHLVINLGCREFRWRDNEGTIRHIRGGAALWSVSTFPLSVDLGEWRSAVFVCFRPGGAYPFIGRPISAIGGPLLDLRTIWGRDGAILRERLLGESAPTAALTLIEDALLARAARPLEPDPVLAYAIPALDRGMPVAKVASQLAVSHATLLRRFAEQVGMPPKRFARIQRLRHLLATTSASSEKDWARAAAECGYSDQAHLIAEFRTLTGTTPSGYHPRLADPHDPELRVVLTNFYKKGDRSSGQACSPWRKVGLANARSAISDRGAGNPETCCVFQAAGDDRRPRSLRESPAISR
jgi:AraC-like DNA-binding protein